MNRYKHTHMLRYAHIRTRRRTYQYTLHFQSSRQMYRRMQTHTTRTEIHAHRDTQTHSQTHRDTDTHTDIDTRKHTQTQTDTCQGAQTSSDHRPALSPL